MTLECIEIIHTFPPGKWHTHKFDKPVSQPSGVAIYSSLVSQTLRVKKPPQNGRGLVDVHTWFYSLPPLWWGSILRVCIAYGALLINYVAIAMKAVVYL